MKTVLAFAIALSGLCAASAVPPQSPADLAETTGLGKRAAWSWCDVEKTVNPIIW